MERTVLLIHGVSEIAKDRLFLSSDNFDLPVCNKCGMIAIRNLNGETRCHNCKTINEDVFQVRVPYATKLYIQFMHAMGISIKIKLNDTDME